MRKRKLSLAYVTSLKEYQQFEASASMIAHSHRQEFWRQFDIYRFKRQGMGDDASEDNMLVRFLQLQIPVVCKDIGCSTCDQPFKPCDIHERK